MEILSQEKLSDIITWLPHGRGFVILQKKRFANEVMPKYFNKKSKFTSFTRKLNRWYVIFGVLLIRYNTKLDVLFLETLPTFYFSCCVHQELYSCHTWSWNGSVLSPSVSEREPSSLYADELHQLQVGTTTPAHEPGGLGADHPAAGSTDATTNGATRDGGNAGGCRRQLYKAPPIGGAASESFAAATKAAATAHGLGWIWRWRCTGYGSSEWRWCPSASWVRHPCFCPGSTRRSRYGRSSRRRNESAAAGKPERSATAASVLNKKKETYGMVCSCAQTKKWSDQVNKLFYCASFLFVAFVLEGMSKTGHALASWDSILLGLTIIWG